MLLDERCRSFPCKKKIKHVGHPLCLARRALPKRNDAGWAGRAELGGIFMPAASIELLPSVPLRQLVFFPCASTGTQLLFLSNLTPILACHSTTGAAFSFDLVIIL